MRAALPGKIYSPDHFRPFPIISGHFVPDTRWEVSAFGRFVKVASEHPAGYESLQQLDRLGFGHGVPRQPVVVDCVYVYLFCYRNYYEQTAILAKDGCQLGQGLWVVTLSGVKGFPDVGEILRSAQDDTSSKAGRSGEQNALGQRPCGEGVSGSAGVAVRCVILRGWRGRRRLVSYGEGMFSGTFQACKRVILSHFKAGHFEM